MVYYILENLNFKFDLINLSYYVNKTYAIITTFTTLILFRRLVFLILFGNLKFIIPSRATVQLKNNK